MNEKWSIILKWTESNSWLAKTFQILISFIHFNNNNNNCNVDNQTKNKETLCESLLVVKQHNGLHSCGYWIKKKKQHSNATDEHCFECFTNNSTWFKLNRSRRSLTSLSNTKEIVHFPVLFTTKHSCLNEILLKCLQRNVQRIWNVFCLLSNIRNNLFA